MSRVLVCRPSYEKNKTLDPECHEKVYCHGIALANEPRATNKRSTLLSIVPGGSYPVPRSALQHPALSHAHVRCTAGCMQPEPP
eukprot:2976063-Prymnesium_polylepis.1